MDEAKQFMFFLISFGLGGVTGILMTNIFEAIVNERVKAILRKRGIEE